MTTESRRGCATITPRALRPCETWQFESHGYNVEIGWLDGKCVADVQAYLGESFGDYFEFPSEAEAVFAVLAWCKDNRRVHDYQADLRHHEPPPGPLAIFDDLPF